MFSKYTVIYCKFVWNVMISQKMYVYWMVKKECSVGIQTKFINTDLTIYIYAMFVMLWGSQPIASVTWQRLINCLHVNLAILSTMVQCTVLLYCFNSHSIEYKHVYECVCVYRNYNDYNCYMFKCSQKNWNIKRTFIMQDC